MTAIAQSTNRATGNDATAPRIALLRPGTTFVAYTEIFAALTDALTQAGAATVRCVDAVRDVSSDDDLLLMAGSPGHYPGLFQDLAALRAVGSHRRVLTFFWHFEPLPDRDTPRALLAAQMLRGHVMAWRHGGDYPNTRSTNFLALRQAMKNKLFDRLWVFTRRKQEFLHRHNIPADYLSMGYHPIWGTWQRPQTSEARDIDVLYLGEQYDARRGGIVGSVRAALAAHGIVLHTMYDFTDQGSLWGDARTAVLNRTKIYLCVYRHPLDSSGMRLSLGMGNGALIVSEPVADAHPFVAGEHFVEAAVPDLADAIRRYLHDEAARQRICAAAHRVLTEQFTLHDTAAQIIEATRAGRADNGPKQPPERGERSQT